MKVELLQPDVAPVAPSSPSDSSAFTRALDGIGGLLGGAERAEDAYAHGTGSLVDAMYERARADVALSVATAAAQRGAQALNSILNMQI